MKTNFFKVAIALFIFSIPFVSKAASISSISPMYVTPGETEVVISGSGFGNSSTGKYIYFGYSSAYSTSWSDSQIRVVAPYSISSSGVIQISGSFSSGQSCNPRTGYCYDQTEYQTLSSQTFYLLPKVTQTTKTIYSKGIFEVSGQYFGTNSGSVSINGNSCQILKWQSNYIKCQVPDIYSQGDSVSYTINVPSSNNYAVSGSVGFLISPSNDTYSFYQTYLKQSKISDVWNKYTGKGVVVAVLDSGVDLQHPDLSGSMWINYRESLNNKKDDDNNGYVDDYYGYNFVANNANMSPYSSHGTMVAGLIAAKRDNSIGIAGIAPNAKIMPLIVCSNYGCPVTAVTKAIKYAVDNGANIINMSLGGDGSLGYDPAYSDAIKYAYDHNVLIITSAGNGDTEGDGTRGQDMDSMKASPVCNEDSANMVLGVGALTGNNKPTYWTNYSMKYVDVSAPGENIFSTAEPLYTNNSASYDWMDGTSFSAPIVAGVAAMLKEEHPTWKNYELMSQIISRSDNFSEGWNVYGTVLNAKSIIENNQPKAELSSIYPNVIDGGQNTITITGKNFYDSMSLRLTNSQFSGPIPTALMKVNNNTVIVDLSKWDAVKPSTEKYSISIDSLDSQKSSLPNALEIRNIIKQIQTVITSPISDPSKPAPANPTIGKKYATFSSVYNIRQSASATSKIITITKKGVKYEVADLSNKDWVKIKIDSKRVGWVMKKFSKITDK